MLKFVVHCVVLGIAVLLKVLDRPLSVSLVCKELALGMQLMSIDTPLHCELAVGAGEENGVLEAEGTLLGYEALVSLVCEKTAVLLFILKEPFGPHGAFIEGRSWLLFPCTFLLLVYEVTVGIRMDRRGIAGDLEATQLTAAFAFADIQITENIARHGLEGQGCVTILTQIGSNARFLVRLLLVAHLNLCLLQALLCDLLFIRTLNYL